MQLGDMYGIVLTFVLVGLILGIGLLVLNNINTSMDTAGAATCASNASVCTGAQVAINETSTAIGTISSTWLPVIVVIVAAAIILGLVMQSFVGKQR